MFKLPPELSIVTDEERAREEKVRQEEQSRVEAMKRLHLQQTLETARAIKDIVGSPKSVEEIALELLQLQNALQLYP